MFYKVLDIFEDKEIVEMVLKKFHEIHQKIKDCKTEELNINIEKAYKCRKLIIEIANKSEKWLELIKSSDFYC